MPVSNDKPKVEPYWKSDCGRAVVYIGDCRKVMEQLEPDQFHAVVTDPPYGLEFSPGMNGKDWDAPWKTKYANDQQPGRTKNRQQADGEVFQDWFKSCSDVVLRIVKPGAHMLSFGGTRMWHRMACAIEDTGFEIRDTIMWVYSCGYPKGRNVSKEIDRIMGAEREVVDTRVLADTTKVRPGFTGSTHSGENSGAKREVNITAPATDLAIKWDGWNTTLRPAWEPIIVSRKYPIATIADNTIEHGCGGINVGGCSVGDQKLWPANLIHDGEDKNLSRHFYSAKANHTDRFNMTDSSGHPTVKPLNLMRYLVRLVCAKGGTVLDPFMGSGSTGVAAIEEGCYFVGIEQSEEYAKIAVDRLKIALGQHQHVAKLESGKVMVKSAPPPQRKLR